MRRKPTLIASLCAGTLLFTASFSEAAEHGMDEKVLSQIFLDHPMRQRTDCEQALFCTPRCRSINYFAHFRFPP
jgi:hypothetical protein